MFDKQNHRSFTNEITQTFLTAGRKYSKWSVTNCFVFSPQGYMRPLKQPDSGSIVDPLLVDEMFYQIPEILEHHEYFLEQVSGCVSQWHDRQTVGHLLIKSVSRDDKRCPKQQFVMIRNAKHYL